MSVFSDNGRTTWASIAKQPAKMQPKSLKSKMAFGLTGSSSKHLPIAVSMESNSWDSKNGPSGGKTIPPPAVISTPSVPQPVVQPLAMPIDELSSVQPPTFIARQQNQSNKEGSYCSNSSIDASVTNSETPLRLSPKSFRDAYDENNENYNPNRYNNNRSNYNDRPLRDNENDRQRGYNDRQRTYYEGDRPRGFNESRPRGYNDNQSSSKDRVGPNSLSSREVIENEAKESFTEPPVLDHPIFDREYVEKNYNPAEFDLNPRNAKFFIIKSYSEDDIHRSIKYSIWCSTEHGNKRLDAAFRQQEGLGPIYLFYSVNRSGLMPFCIGFF